MKRAAEISSERFREVFNETCRQGPFRDMIIESSMCKRRRYLLPPLPNDAEDFSKVIAASPFIHLYPETVKHDGAVAIGKLPKTES